MAAVSNALDDQQLRACLQLLQRSGKVVESIVQGDSMGSTIPDGSKIRILSVPPDALKNGDIVACVADGFLSAHRLVYGGAKHESATGYLITQGDAWILCDGPRPLATLLGVVEECFIGGSWVRPSATPPRSEAEQRAAARQVVLMTYCLRRSAGLARFVARRLLTVYTIRENIRILLRRTS